MEELLWQHNAILLEDHSVLHHELDVAQGVDIGQWVAANRDHVSEHPGFDRASLLDNVGSLVSVDRQRLENVDGRDLCRLPGFEERNGQLPASEPGPGLVVS